jgi:hypothetical protein
MFRQNAKHVQKVSCFLQCVTTLSRQLSATPQASITSVCAGSSSSSSGREERKWLTTNERKHIVLSTQNYGASQKTLNNDHQVKFFQISKIVFKNRTFQSHIRFNRWGRVGLVGEKISIPYFSAVPSLPLPTALIGSARLTSWWLLQRSISPRRSREGKEEKN